MSSNEERPWRQDNLGVFGELPGDLMMWVLIASELLVFGAALIAFLAVRATDPAGFSADQALLDRTAGALNTAVLVTSGLCAGLAVVYREREEAYGDEKAETLDPWERPADWWKQPDED